MIATDELDVSRQEYWSRGGIEASGLTRSRHFGAIHHAGAANKSNLPGRPPGSNDPRVNPDETRSDRFVLAWYFPNATNCWNPVDLHEGIEPSRQVWRNYCATLLPDAVAVARYGIKNWERLTAETERFQHTLFMSTLPHPVLEAVAANISILKTVTVLRLTDGSFYGFKGCHATEGSCEGSCRHLWNYAYALPFLFPALERSMRDLDLAYNQREDGRMTFRLQLPLGRSSDFRACVNGSGVC